MCDLSRSRASVGGVNFRSTDDALMVSEHRKPYQEGHNRCAVAPVFDWNEL
jgi:hypothetical protein